MQRRRSELEAELRIAEAQEEFTVGVDELMLWLDDAAEELTPEVILSTFVRFAEIGRDEVRVYFAFDSYGDDFTPAKKKGEPSTDVNSSPNSPMVELMRKTANSRDFSEQGNHSIQLDTCIVQATNNWFVIVGLLEKNLIKAK